MGFLSNYQPGSSLAGSDFWKAASTGGLNPMPGNPNEFYDNESGYSFIPKYKEQDFKQTFDGGTMYYLKDNLGGDNANLNGRQGYVYDANGNPTDPGFKFSNLHKNSGLNNPLIGSLGVLSLPFAASAAGLGAGAGAATGAGMTTAEMAGVGASVIPEGVAFSAPTAAEMATMTGAAGAGAGAAAGGFTLENVLRQLGGKTVMNAIPGLFNGGGSSNGGGAGGGSGGFNLGDIFNVGAGVYGSQKQGEAAQKYMDWMNGQQNYVRNYGTEGTPEFEYLKKTLEAKDAAAGRNSQYGVRTADLLGQLGQAKLDASSRMALGFANPYQKALNQDANKYAGLPAAINKLIGGGGGGLSVQNLSSILTGLGGSTGLSTNDFLDMVNADSGMPTGIGYDPSQMPTEEDIMPFLDFFGQEDWLGF